MANEDIRKLLKDNRLFIWEISQFYGCTESTLSKKLRIELSKEEKKKIFDIIEKLRRQ
jgi:hypothetical protein